MNSTGGVGACMAAWKYEEVTGGKRLFTDRVLPEHRSGDHQGGDVLGKTAWERRERERENQIDGHTGLVFFMDKVLLSCAKFSPPLEGLLCAIFSPPNCYRVVKFVRSVLSFVTNVREIRGEVVSAVAYFM